MSRRLPADPFAPVPGNPRAAEEIWGFMRADSGTGLHGERDTVRRARRTGLTRACLSFALAALLFFLGWVWVFWVAVLAGALSLAGAVLSPLWLHPKLDKLLQTFVVIVGTIMTWLLLAPIYFLVFLPFGLLFRRNRNDKLRRWTDPGASTYWVRRDRQDTPEHSHRRQF